MPRTASAITPSPLARYHQVLLAVSKNPGGVSMHELMADTQLPRSSAHRIAASLCSLGYLETNDAGHYAFGPVFNELIRYSLTADNRLQAFQPALQYLATELNETAFFARFIGGSVDLAHAVTPAFAERSYIYPGTGNRPLDTCSSSKAILAYADPEMVRQMFDEGSLPLSGEDALQVFQDTLRQASMDGYAICDGEIDEGVYSIACPVPAGAVLGLFSIGVVGPSSRMRSTGVDRLLEVVQKAAGMAARQLASYTPRPLA
ncbi:MAG: IclR family transcriptional regulator C-terminal domain-containing protein [Pseudomonadota bacterium]